MRRVKVFKWDRLDGETVYSKFENGEAKFHRWGTNYEEFDNGAGNFSTAIIERDDGTVENIEVQLIAFID